MTPVSTTPTDETARLRKLAELALLDGPIDPVIDRTCALAAEFFRKRFAFVSLVAEGSAHIYAHCGLASGSVPRREAFCDVTIQRDTPLIINDTRADPRFRTSILVVDDPKIRFYAGVPLVVSPGARIGALCVADTEPNEFSERETRMLVDFASIVAGQIVRDAGKQNLARQAVTMANQQAILQQTERFAEVGGFQADPASGAMVWSDGLHQLFERKTRDAITIDTFAGYFDAASQGRIRAGFARLAADGLELDFEGQIVGDHLRQLFVHVHAERRRDAGAPDHVVGIVQNVTERRVALAELERIATHDALTGLLDRRAFNESVDEAIIRSAEIGFPVALIMLDVDRFKTINDTLGHDAGDMVLTAVAQRLVEAAGAKGLVGRIGGDEFAILIGRVEAEGEVAALATKVLLALRQPCSFKGLEVSTRATFGVAIADRAAQTAGDLFKDADLALYNAKQAGRDGFAFYRSSMRQQLEGRLNRLSVARAAIADDRFEPYYQPKICLSTGHIAGFEALLRWNLPDGTLCGPTDMAEAFADIDLAVAIGRGMIGKVVRDIAGWRLGGLPVGRVAINVAEPEFHAGDYAETLLSFIETAGLTADAIEIEVTESVFLGQRSGIVAMTLRKLADAGIRITLDDFGTGYASLTHLRQHPVTAIKIDKSFVAEVESDGSAASIVRAVTSLANSLKIDVVGEGVETAFQRDFLREHACTLGQGFHFARPMPAGAVARFVRGCSVEDATPLRSANG